MKKNTTEKIKDILEETVDIQKISLSSDRKLYIELRNSDWGKIYDVDTYPRLFCMDNSRDMDKKALWDFYSSPYGVYNPETKLWEFDIPRDADLFQVFCNKKDSNGNNWQLAAYCPEMSKLPPKSLYHNIKLVQDTDGGGCICYNADTGTRRIVLYGIPNESLQNYVAHYGSWTVGPKKIDVPMIPMGYIEYEYVGGNAYQYYYVDVPEFDDDGNRIDDIKFTCAETFFNSQYYQINFADTHTSSFSTTIPFFGLQVFCSYSDSTIECNEISNCPDLSKYFGYSDKIEKVVEDTLQFNRESAYYSADELQNISIRFFDEFTIRVSNLFCNNINNEVLDQYLYLVLNSNYECVMQSAIAHEGDANPSEYIIYGKKIGGYWQITASCFNNTYDNIFGGEITNFNVALPHTRGGEYPAGLCSDSIICSFNMYTDNGNLITGSKFEIWGK